MLFRGTKTFLKKRTQNIKRSVGDKTSNIVTQMGTVLYFPFDSFLIIYNLRTVHGSCSLFHTNETSGLEVCVDLFQTICSEDIVTYTTPGLNK